MGAAAGALLAPSLSAYASPGDIDLMRGSRVIRLHRPETREHLYLEYLRGGQWVPGAYERICWFMRDWHVGRHVAMDTRLIAILDWTQSYLRQYGYAESIEFLSGYRSEKTNRSLENAAQKSKHLTGEAMDLRIHGLPADYLGKLYQWLSQGGVGVYPGREFVHVDTGRVRSWQG